MYDIFLHKLLFSHLKGTLFERSVDESIAERDAKGLEK